MSVKKFAVDILTDETQPDGWGQYCGIWYENDDGAEIIDQPSNAVRFEAEVDLSNLATGSCVTLVPESKLSTEPSILKEDLTPYSALEKIMRTLDKQTNSAAVRIIRWAMNQYGVNS